MYELYKNNLIESETQLYITMFEKILFKFCLQHNMR